MAILVRNNPLALVDPMGMDSIDCSQAPPEDQACRPPNPATNYLDYSMYVNQRMWYSQFDPVLGWDAFSVMLVGATLSSSGGGSGGCQQSATITYRGIGSETVTFDPTLYLSPVSLSVAIAIVAQATSSGPVNRPPKNGPRTCANGVGSGGIGLGAGYNLDLGVAAAGASSTGGVGAGAFHNRGGGFTSGYSAGAFASGGAAAYAGSHVAGVPQQSGSTVFALGAYAGAGANLFVSNAASVQQLSGPFTTLSVNVGVGVANLGVQVSLGGGIWQFSITPPIASVGIGFAGSVITTNTVTTSTGCH